MWKAAVVLVLVLLAGAVYEAIRSRSLANDARALVESIGTERDNLRRRLDASIDRVSDLEGSVVELQRSGEDLGRRLADSQATAADLRADNQRLGERLGVVRTELERSRATASRLREENRELGEAITAGIGSAGSVADSVEELGRTVDRIGEILNRYTGDG